ncbi:hypothetical protein GCM10010345_28470 [Streptomyces canarius]|uniref:Beta-lactamase-related domain-containing protein n=1 Tax=Streptomyces canarius TaxID=285453 RepID=A0ABQ3CL03_9ACTN|nr:hypothetical protein GCM10010345_28470 [Streptomyces canarius]
MPTLRTAPSIPVSLALLLAPAAVRNTSGHTSPVTATDAVLPLRVSVGHTTCRVCSAGAAPTTPRALPTHTSGLADLTQATREAVRLTPPQAVRIALALPPARPGRCSSSSTHYVLLGPVVRQVTGHSRAAEAEHRAIAPLDHLGLTGTSFP